jgi:hypothetical protein
LVRAEGHGRATCNSPNVIVGVKCSDESFR